jgi:Domain of unknown function (DUF6458)
VTVGIGFSIFLFVIGAILTFAVEVEASGFNLTTVGIILMVGGLLGLVASVLFWSSFSPWSRRRTLAGGDTVVEERRASAISPDPGEAWKLRRQQAIGAFGAGRLADADSEPPHRLRAGTIPTRRSFSSVADGPLPRAA